MSVIIFFLGAGLILLGGLTIISFVISLDLPWAGAVALLVTMGVINFFAWSFTIDTHSSYNAYKPDVARILDEHYESGGDIVIKRWSLLNGSGSVTVQGDKTCKFLFSIDRGDSVVQVDTRPGCVDDTGLIVEIVEEK